MKKTADIITDWIEKNIDKFHYQDFDKNGKLTGEMFFNKELLRKNIAGIIPDIKNSLKKNEGTRNKKM